MKALKKRFCIVLGVINIVFLVCILVLAMILNEISGSLESQNIVERWVVDDTRSSQFSLFFSENLDTSLNDIYTLRQSIDDGLVEASISAPTENGRVFIDAYSSEKQFYASSTRKDYTPTASVTATLTGGDFFLFHPLKMLSGSYYLHDSLMKDRILIDENLAWQFFGSSNAVDMPIKINGLYFYVAGVFEVPDDDETSFVYGEKPRIFLDYNFFTDENYQNENIISSYEICIPDPVKNFATNILDEKIFFDENEYALVENSARYDLFNLTDYFFDGGVNAAVTKSITYPYWENAARISTSKASKFAGFIAILAVVPILSLLFGIVMLWVKRKAIWKFIFDKIKLIYIKLKPRFKHRNMLIIKKLHKKKGED